jgi:hypothetical protein
MIAPVLKIPDKNPCAEADKNLHVDDQVHQWTFAGFAPTAGCFSITTLARLIYVCPRCKKFTYQEVEFVGYRLGDDDE